MLRGMAHREARASDDAGCGTGPGIGAAASTLDDVRPARAVAGLRPRRRRAHRPADDGDAVRLDHAHAALMAVLRRPDPMAPRVVPAPLRDRHDPFWSDPRAAAELLRSLGLDATKRPAHRSGVAALRRRPPRLVPERRAGRAAESDARRRGQGARRRRRHERQLAGAAAAIHAAVTLVKLTDELDLSVGTTFQGRPTAG